MAVTEAFLLKIDSLYRCGLTAKAYGRAVDTTVQPETRIKGRIKDKNAGAALRRGGI